MAYEKITFVNDSPPAVNATALNKIQTQYDEAMIELVAKALLTTQGDIPYATAASTWARLAKGTAGQELRINSGATAPEWYTPILQANLLTNGGFDVGWQRGAGPFTADNAYTSDRWQIQLDGTDTISVSREGTTKNVNSLYALKAVFTYGNSGLTNVRQKLVISDNFHHLLGKSVSFKLSVHASAASAVRAFIYTDGTGGTITRSSYHPGGAAWSDLKVENVAIPTDATYILVGVDFGSTNVTVYLDNAMLVVGSQAVDYMPLHPAEEMARCQRYYEVVGVAGDNTIIIGGDASAASQTFYLTMPFKVNKAVTPTVTKIGTWNTTNCGQPTVDVVGLYAFRFNTVSSAAGIFHTENSTDGTNFIAEANP